MLQMVMLKCCSCEKVFGIINEEQKAAFLEYFLQDDTMPAVCPFCHQNVQTEFVKRMPFPISDVDIQEEVL